MPFLVHDTQYLGREPGKAANERARSHNVSKYPDSPGMSRAPQRPVCIPFSRHSATKTQASSWASYSRLLLISTTFLSHSYSTISNNSPGLVCFHGYMTQTETARWHQLCNSSVPAAPGPPPPNLSDLSAIDRLRPVLP